MPAGADGLRLLPYLQGERTPVWDAGACGAFVGLSLVHGRGHLYRAVLEGVAVSFRHCAEIAAEKGLRLREVIAVNGGARSAVWRQILCDALGVPLLYVPDGAGAPDRRRAARGHGGRAGGRGGDRPALAQRAGATRPRRGAAPRPTRACSRAGASSTRRSARSPDGPHRHPRGRLHGLGPDGARDRQRPHRRALGHAPRRPPDRGGARRGQASQARPRPARGGDRVRFDRAAAGARRRGPRDQRGDVGRRAPGAATRGDPAGPGGAGAERVQGPGPEPRPGGHALRRARGLAGLHIVTVGGPSKALELARRVPTAVVYASPQAAVRRRLRQMLETAYYRVEESADQRGLELCSALKNAYAIAIGLCDGLVAAGRAEAMYNTKSALYTQALREIARLGAHREDARGHRPRPGRGGRPARHRHGRAQPRLRRAARRGPADPGGRGRRSRRATS